MKRLLLLLTLLLPLQLQAQEFSLHKQDGSQSGPTLLVIGGIQGDEPGGFNAAALLTTHYRVDRGTLWVVPNLNFASILKRTRGLHGDMNRKFDRLATSDPEYSEISRIKEIIVDPQVDLVFNLHDGSGFYHPTHIDHIRNPDRWGQSCIIDQRRLPESPFGQLEQLSNNAIARVNAAALSATHNFHLKNTETAAGDQEMQQSLTYFAVRNNKPAFGIEASKSFPTHVRVYYHLQAIEAYMDQVGLRYTRNFDLTPAGVKNALYDNVLVSFGEGRIKLKLKNLRPTLKYFPLPREKNLGYSSNNPLVAVLPYRNSYRIHYGNNRLSFLKPQYFDYDRGLDTIEIQVDGENQQVKLGSTVAVSNQFLVRGKSGYRVNVIGFKKPGQRNESGLSISKQQILNRYSIDKAGQIFRVEVYRGKQFSGMVLVDFSPRAKTQLVAQHKPAQQ